MLVLFLHKSVKKTIQNSHLFVHITGESKMTEAWQGLVTPRLLEAFPLLSSGFSLFVSSTCLHIDYILCGKVPDNPASVVLEACITERRVSFLTVLTEGPRADFDWSIWGPFT